MTSPQLNQSTRTSSHRIHRPQLTLQMRLPIPPIPLTSQQPRNQQPQRMQRQLIGGRRHTNNRTQRFHAVIHRANARTQPYRVRRGLR